VKRRGRRYGPLSVVGLELEYAIVNRRLEPVCLVEDAFRMLNGRPTSDVDRGAVGFSNELAAHVFEMKMARPDSDLAAAETRLVRALSEFLALLRDRFDARLLPTGMHPFMSPRDTELWRRGNRRVYETYAKVFGIREHGWLNVQSCHVNLPFGRTERDLVTLHNAVACLLPYLPALAASSPVVEGRRGPGIDSRLVFYRKNQRRVPVVSGAVIPAFIDSVADYRRTVLAPIYRELRRIDGAERLRHEWVNSRGAILRFARRALEIRVLDVQECVRMDVAVATFVRATLRWLMRELETGSILLPDHAMLVSDFGKVIERGRDARVAATHVSVRGSRTAAAVLEALLDRARAKSRTGERPYLDLVAGRIARGNLSERILARAGRAEGARLRVKLEDVYAELMLSLETNRPWAG